ncbi:putative inorganic phosphate cotransporter isoform X3 [Solenopsis invicta]|uniref:putative inorganic phosphate cotransporter isoform X3 n=1 Tax=Solenopsis invicta TaxID=13686 RepID=UPI000E33F954|nr:putative inorganic phosphate cotransporter isoform X3 [Solenopsis invicta]
MASNRNVRDCLSCRQVLNIMVILGFMLNYMLRMNLTIAIVSMVIQSNSSGQHSHSNGSASMPDECGAQAMMMNDLTPINDTRTPVIDVNRVNEMNSSSGFTASPFVRIRTVTMYNTPGERVQTKYSWNEYEGATWPAIQPMTARWIPPTERSKFVSHMMASSLGAAITMLMCGFLIASLGWESVFYVTGVIGIIWSVAWFLLVFDSPSQHPRISAEERHFIESAIGTTTTAKPLPIPWRALITSGPVWAIVITHACSVFSYHTIVNQLPTYMKYILHFNIKENGLLSSLPYLGKYIFALATSTLADYLRRNNKLSVTAIRKIFTTLAVLTPGILMVIQAYYGCNRVASVAVFTIALTINGAVTAGYLGNGLDIAPNFSGTIFGLANTFSSIGGFLSTFMVGNITYQNQTYTQWTIIFWILAAVYFSGSVTFVIFGTGELQSWNNPVEMHNHKKENGTTVEDGAESVPLKSKIIS